MTVETRCVISDAGDDTDGDDGGGDALGNRNLKQKRATYICNTLFCGQLCHII